MDCDHNMNSKKQAIEQNGLLETQVASLKKKKKPPFFFLNARPRDWRISVFPLFAFSQAPVWEEGICSHVSKA